MLCLRIFSITRLMLACLAPILFVNASYAAPLPIPANVRVLSLDSLGFPAAINEPSVRALAVSRDGRRVYFGRLSSYASDRRNLAVVTLHENGEVVEGPRFYACLLYTSPSPRD